MESNRGKKKPGRGARPKKTPGRAAKAKAKVAVVGEDEEPAAVVITDPWLGLRYFRYFLPPGIYHTSYRTYFKAARKDSADGLI